MLAVTPLRSSTAGDRAGDVGASNLATSDDFSLDFDFDFSELFAGFDDAELLPSVEIDAIDLPASEASMAEVEASGGRESQQEEEIVLTNYEEALSCEMKEEASAASEIGSPAPPEKDKEKERGRKSTAGQAKGSNGKRKKYRSHRKHMMAREAEMTSSNQRRHVYAAWLPPIIGFPPNAPPPVPPHRLHHHPHMHHFRPLHVWGHPTIDQSLVHMWPKPIVPIGPTPSSPWVAPHPIQPPPLMPHGSPWPPHFVRGTLTQGTPYFPQPMPTLRFPALPVPGIPPHPMYRAPDGVIPAVAPPAPPPSKQTGLLLQLDAHPSKESIDAALGDVLAQPWLPLPLGLKPPALESVMVELQKQGISNVPPCN